MHAGFTEMHWKVFVAISLIGAGLGDGLAASAVALCRPSQAQAACCCGTQCEGRSETAAGLRQACCDMQRAPRRDAEASTAARDLPPPPPIAVPLVPVMTTTADVACNAEPLVLDLPESLHAPPLYELFRSYRI